MLYKPEPSPINVPEIGPPSTTNVPLINSEPVICKSFVVA